MKKLPRTVLISICAGLLLALVSGLLSKSSRAIIITTTPDYCIGPAVVGYKCPDVTAKAQGLSRGFPLPFRYEAVTIQEQEGFLKPKTLDNGSAQFDTRNFLLDVIAWSLMAGAFIVVFRKTVSKIRK